MKKNPVEILEDVFLKTLNNQDQYNKFRAFLIIRKHIFWILTRTHETVAAQLRLKWLYDSIKNKNLNNIDFSNDEKKYVELLISSDKNIENILLFIEYNEVTVSRREMFSLWEEFIVPISIPLIPLFSAIFEEELYDINLIRKYVTNTFLSYRPLFISTNWKFSSNNEVWKSQLDEVFAKLNLENINHNKVTSQNIKFFSNINNILYKKYLSNKSMKLNDNLEFNPGILKLRFLFSYLFS